MDAVCAVAGEDAQCANGNRRCAPGGFGEIVSIEAQTANSQ